MKRKITQFLSRSRVALPVILYLTIGVCGQPVWAQTTTISLLSGDGVGDEFSLDQGTWNRVHIVASHPAWAKISGTEYVYCGPTNGVGDLEKVNIFGRVPSDHEVEADARA